jgi:hypothetical protein
MTGEWLPEERLRTVEGGLFRLMTVVPEMECPPDPVKELWCGHAASSGMMFLREVLMMGECTAKSREGQCQMDDDSWPIPSIAIGISFEQ